MTITPPTYTKTIIVSNHLFFIPKAVAVKTLIPNKPAIPKKGDLDKTIEDRIRMYIKTQIA